MSSSAPRHNLRFFAICALLWHLAMAPHIVMAEIMERATPSDESLIAEIAESAPLASAQIANAQIANRPTPESVAVTNTTQADDPASKDLSSPNEVEAIATWRQPTQETQPATGPSQGAASSIELEFEPDAYYTSLDLFLPLTNTPIPVVSGKSEGGIYGDLLMKSHRPRYVALEGSVYPMPALGAFVRKNMEDLYEDAQLRGDLNLIKVITAGFEEPYALSLFIGNVVRYRKPGQAEASAGNLGWVGYLVSHGDYHIKDNLLIYDKWYEFEWKIKGDREFTDTRHSWSFRLGLKFHDNPAITDVYYISARRSRLEFRSSASSIKHNSAFEYTYDMSRHGLHAVQHKFFVEKKFPFKKYKAAFTLALGFIWDSGRKYTGELAPEGIRESYQYIIRPNIQF